MRNRTKHAPWRGFHASRFHSCPSNGFSMNRSKRRASYGLRSRAQVSVGSLQREKKNSTAISHRVRRQEGWTDQTGDEQRSTCNPATSPPVNEPEESGLWRNCLPEAMNHTEHKSHVQWIAQGSIKVHTEVWVFFVLYSIWLSVTSLSIACFVHFQV